MKEVKKRTFSLDDPSCASFLRKKEYPPRAPLEPATPWNEVLRIWTRSGAISRAPKRPASFSIADVGIYTCAVVLMTWAVTYYLTR